MDEDQKVEQNMPAEKAQVATNPTVPASSHRNLILAIGALIVGAVIISAILVVSLPKEEETIVPIPSKTNTVTNINKTSDLDTASSELDSVDLDGYVNELKQNDTDASQF